MAPAPGRRELHLDTWAYTYNTRLCPNASLQSPWLSGCPICRILAVACSSTGLVLVGPGRSPPSFKLKLVLPPRKLVDRQCEQSVLSFPYLQLPSSGSSSRPPVLSGYTLYVNLLSRPRSWAPTSGYTSSRAGYPHCTPGLLAQANDIWICNIAEVEGVVSASHVRLFRPQLQETLSCWQKA